MNLNNYNSYNEKLNLCYRFIKGELGKASQEDINETLEDVKYYKDLMQEELLK